MRSVGPNPQAGPLCQRPDYKSSANALVNLQQDQGNGVLRLAQRNLSRVNTVSIVAEVDLSSKSFCSLATCHERDGECADSTSPHARMRTFFRCVPHFAQSIQCTGIGSRYLSDSLCVSPKSSDPRTMPLLGVFLSSLRSLLS